MEVENEVRTVDDDDGIEEITPGVVEVTPGVGEVTPEVEEGIKDNVAPKKPFDKRDLLRRQLSVKVKNAGDPSSELYSIYAKALREYREEEERERQRRKEALKRRAEEEEESKFRARVDYEIGLATAELEQELATFRLALKMAEEGKGIVDELVDERINEYEKEAEELKRQVAVLKGSAFCDEETMKRTLEAVDEPALDEERDHRLSGGYAMVDLTILGTALEQAQLCGHGKLILTEIKIEKGLSSRLAFVCSKCCEETAFCTSTFSKEHPANYAIDKSLLSLIGSDSYYKLCDFMRKRTFRSRVKLKKRSESAKFVVKYDERKTEAKLDSAGEETDEIELDPFIPDVRIDGIPAKSRPAINGAVSAMKKNFLKSNPNADPNLFPEVQKRPPMIRLRTDLVGNNVGVPMPLVPSFTQQIAPKPTSFPIARQPGMVNNRGFRLVAPNAQRPFNARTILVDTGNRLVRPGPPPRRLLRHVFVQPPRHPPPPGNPALSAELQSILDRVQNQIPRVQNHIPSRITSMNGDMNSVKKIRASPHLPQGCRVVSVPPGTRIMSQNVAYASPKDTNLGLGVYRVLENNKPEKVLIVKEVNDPPVAIVAMSDVSENAAPKTVSAPTYSVPIIQNVSSLTRSNNKTSPIKVTSPFEEHRSRAVTVSIPAVNEPMHVESEAMDVDPLDVSNDKEVITLDDDEDDIRPNGNDTVKLVEDDITEVSNFGF